MNIPSQPMKNQGYLIAAISAISYGLIPIFILPVQNAGLPLDNTLFYRFFISALFLLAYLIYKKENLAINLKEMGIMAILGLLYAFAADFLFIGYEYLTPGIASTIMFVYPVIVAIIMSTIFKEKLTKLTIIALCLTFLGIVALSWKESLSDISFFGITVSLLCALFYGLYIIIVNKSKITFSSFKVTFYSLVFSSVYYFMKCIILGNSLAIDSVGTLFNLTLFSFVTTVISMLALVYAIQLIGSTPTSIMGALEPVVAVAISVLLFNEKFTLSLVIGVSLIIIGVIMNILDEKKKNI